MASAACIVGSSRFVTAGVLVLDRERLVDFPNDPVSGAVFLALDIFGLPSVLEKVRCYTRYGVVRFLT
jgi:hypothetical protein